MRSIFLRYPVSSLVFFTNIIFSIFFLSLNYWHYPIASVKDLAMIFGHWVVVSSASFAIVVLLSINRWIYMFFGFIYFMLCAFALFFVVRMDISLNADLLHSVVNTSFEEANGLVSLKLCLFMLVAFALFVISVSLRFKAKLTIKDFGILFSLLTVSLLFFGFFFSQRSLTFLRRVPLSFYFAVVGHYENQKMIHQNRVMIGDGSSCTVDSMTIVLVIGEALRADHLQMNGYNRVTMPNMERRGVISFPNVKSIYTQTWHSVPHILTRADSIHPKLAYSESSFIDVFKKAGYHATWLGNQLPDASFRFFVEECDSILLNKPHLTDFSNSKKLDSDLIQPFSNVSTLSAKNLVIMHLVGNHWWYNGHFPDSLTTYRPIMSNKDFSDDNRQKMINSYDNVTLFTDFVLDQCFKVLENKNSVVIFVSDHGESFGENGKWLHANDNEPEMHPACFVWMSERFKITYPDMLQNVIANKDSPIETAFVFHSILHAAQISTPYLNLSESIFSKVRQPQLESIYLVK